MDFCNLDIIEINELKNKMKECAEKDWWFEISGESAELLYKYVSSIEQSLLYCCDDKKQEEKGEK